MKPVSADVNQQAGRQIPAAVEQFSDGLIAASEGAKRVQR
jgi:hypothetical protein